MLAGFYLQWRRRKTRKFAQVVKEVGFWSVFPDLLSFFCGPYDWFRLAISLRGFALPAFGRCLSALKVICLFVYLWHTSCFKLFWRIYIALVIFRHQVHSNGKIEGGFWNLRVDKQRKVCRRIKTWYSTILSLMSAKTRFTNGCERKIVFLVLPVALMRYLRGLRQLSPTWYDVSI